MRLPFRLAAVLALALLSLPAAASPFYFTFTVNGDTSPLLTFTVPDQPVISTTPNTPYIYVSGFPIFVREGNGINDTVLGGIRLYPGGFDFNSGDNYLNGATIYAGGPSNLTFFPGTYNLTFNNVTVGFPYPSRANGVLSLVSTPEPSSIALLGTGLLGFAGTLRRNSPMLKNKVCLKV